MPTRLALLGFGEVGRALAARLAKRSDLVVTAVADRSGGVVDPSGVDLAALLHRKRATGTVGGDASRHARWVAEHAEADALVDLLPTDLKTAEPSLHLQEAALRRGLDIVTANKGPLALHGGRIRAAAKAAGREVRASGAVMGGTPALELLEGAFAGDRLLRLDGVLNGSTNLVLSRLERGETWDEALRAAREAGALEADPSLDLLGLDAAAKAVILANAAWGSAWTIADVAAEGILDVTPEEAVDAARRGMALRLVARASADQPPGVAPVMLPRDHPLVADGKENVLRLTLEDAGVVTLRGPGAGGPETASAVLGDLLALR